MFERPVRAAPSPADAARSGSRRDGMPGQPSRLAPILRMSQAVHKRISHAHPCKPAMNRDRWSSTTDGWSRCGLCPHFWISNRRRLDLDRWARSRRSARRCRTRRRFLAAPAPGTARAATSASMFQRAEGRAAARRRSSPRTSRRRARGARPSRRRRSPVGQVALAGWRRCWRPTGLRRRRAAPRGPAPRRGPGQRAAASSAIDPPSLCPSSTARSMPAASSTRGTHLTGFAVHEVHAPGRRRAGRSAPWPCRL